MTKNYYSDLASIDVSEHIEKKGKFSYLSWAWAVDQLRKVDPTATWEVKRFEGIPYMKTECGYFVEVAVTVQGITLSQIHPVLDNYNKPIQKPNAFQINTSIQRCLVKAIALHGLGLYIYAGEDLPMDAEPKEETKEEPKTEKPISPKQLGTIKTKVKQIALARNVTDSEVYEKLGVQEVEQLTSPLASKAISTLEKWVSQLESKGA